MKSQTVHSWSLSQSENIKTNKAHRVEGCERLWKRSLIIETSWIMGCLTNPLVMMEIFAIPLTTKVSSGLIIAYPFKSKAWFIPASIPLIATPNACEGRRTCVVKRRLRVTVQPAPSLLSDCPSHSPCIFAALRRRSTATQTRIQLAAPSPSTPAFFAISSPASPATATPSRRRPHCSLSLAREEKQKNERKRLGEKGQNWREWREERKNWNWMRKKKKKLQKERNEEIKRRRK